MLCWQPRKLDMCKPGDRVVITAGVVEAVSGDLPICSKLLKRLNKNHQLSKNVVGLGRITIFVVVVFFCNVSF